MSSIGLEHFPASDDLTRFRLAAAYCAAHPGSVLHVPAGTYLLRDPDAVRLQDSVMSGKWGNNVESVMFHPDFSYVRGVLFRDCENISLESEGAKLVFDGFLEPLTVERCKGFTLRGITLDTLRKPFSSGTVSDVDADSVTVDFGKLSLLSPKMPVLRVLLRRNGRISQIIPDLRRAGVVPELLSGGNVKFHNLKTQALPGDEFNLWHTFHFRPAIHLHESKDITLEDVTIYSQPGMGILGHRSCNISLNRIRVIPEYGYGVSTNTDATHFASCGGFLKIMDSVFCGHGDDAVNVHTYYHRILETDHCNCACIMDLKFGTHSQLSDHPDAGDTLELTDPETLQPLERFLVKSVKETGYCRSQLVLDHSLPPDIEGKLLIDVSQVPRFEFRNCSVSDHFARAVLIKTRDALVEHCRIEGSSGTAIQIAAESFWMEGPVSQYVTIRDNRIASCGGGPGTIHRIGGIVIEGGTGHKHIRIENNRIDCLAMEHGIFLSGAENLLVLGNQIQSAGEPLVIENCHNVRKE